MQDLKYAMDAIHRITQESIDAIVKLYVVSGSTGNPGSSPPVNFEEPANFGDFPVPANIAKSQDPKQFELREDPRYNILQCSAPSQNSPNSPNSLSVKSSGYAGSSPEVTTAVNIPKRAEYVDPNLHNFTL